MEYEDVTTSCKMTAKAQWSNLPHDLLSQISNRLELVEFLRFRAVCKDWNIASSKISPRGDKFSLGYYPWLLVYGGEGSSQCSLLSTENKIYTANIPQLDGATCLASHEGWLLVFNHGSLIFYCPFSKAKIQVPDCPFTELTNHVAAFSCPPTSQDCVVAVVNLIDENELELHLLCRGSNQWTRHNYVDQNFKFNSISDAMFYEGQFHFFDRLVWLVIFDIAAKTEKWKTHRIYAPRYSASDESDSDELNNLTPLKFRVCSGGLELKGAKEKLGLGKNVSISSCGTRFPHYSGKYDVIVQSENIEAETTESESRGLKGVWIQPIYFYVPPDLSCW